MDHNVSPQHHEDTRISLLHSPMGTALAPSVHALRNMSPGAREVNEPVKLIPLAGFDVSTTSVYAV